MSSPWRDNIFTSKKKKKKAVTATSDLSSSSVMQGHRGTVHGNMAAARVQRQVQQQQNQQRSPVPMSTPVAMSFSNGQPACFCPNSCADVDVT
jgi:hypothetical protein